jgi:hypothetical protein
MAESLRGHLSAYSNAVTRNFIVPSPRQKSMEFIQMLAVLIEEHKIDLLVPTCEEIFYVAMGRDQLACNVFADTIEKLDMLHNKWTFFLQAIEHGLPTPQTMQIENRDQLKQAHEKWPRLVLKPAYSRFAAHTYIQPGFEQSCAVIANKDISWIAQEYIDGNPICTYSVCHKGRITAHTAYRSDFTAGATGTILLSHIDHPAIFERLQAFLADLRFTGQVAFDFMETSDGRLLAMECNPHANGIPAVLLSSNPDFASTFTDEGIACVTPVADVSRMILMGMLLYGLPASLQSGRFDAWWRALCTSRDLIFRIEDPLPAIFQFRSLFHFFILASWRKMSFLDASMLDIEWNGSMTPEMP